MTAAGAVLWDPADGRVLAGRDATVPRPMASTTKIMTALLALEAGALDEQLTVSENAAAVGRISGAASLGLRAGERLPVRSVLAGLVLRSGNDAAIAIAEHVAGTRAAFVARMNARARELGLAHTAFVNASGLTDDPAHHASPLDLARLAEAAMAHPAFARWAGAPALTVPGLGTLRNRNELLLSYEGATGVKTGYTDLAGLCLVASATRDDRTLYAVVLDSEASFADASRLLDHGFDDFRRVSLLDAGERVTRYRWAGGRDVPVVAERALAATVPTAADVRWRVRLAPALDRPLEAGAVAGTAELLVDGEIERVTQVVLGTPAAAPRDPGGAAAAGRAIQNALRAYARLAPLERSM